MLSYKRQRYIEIILLIAGTLAVEHLFLSYLPCSINSSPTRCADCECSCTDLKSLHESLAKIARLIAEAQSHARSGHAMKSLSDAFSRVSKLLKDATDEDQALASGLVWRHSNQRNISDPLDVCPEIWLARGKAISAFDGPYFVKGYENENCGSVKRFENVLSILLDAVHYNETYANLQNITNEIRQRYNNLSVIIALPEPRETKQTVVDTHTTYHYFSDIATELEVWTTLVEHAQTKYVLLGRAVNFFDQFSYLERLVRVLSHTHAEIVGGAYREPSGKWYTGCSQLNIRNYTLHIVEGYDLSYNSCLYCDYLSGPFATRKTYILERFKQQNATKSGPEFWLEFFVNVFIEDSFTNLVCPDVMFHASPNSWESMSKTSFLAIVRKFELNRLILPNKDVFSFSCVEAGTICDKRAGLILPICCLESLSLAIRTLASHFETNGLFLDAKAGTVIGALKFQGIIPWERDADLSFYTANYTNIKALIPVINAIPGYTLKAYEEEYRNDAKFCMRPEGKPCGYLSLTVPDWNVELWGLVRLVSSTNSPRKPTKVPLDSYWISVYPNPARSMRNVYGDDIFEHIEHVSHLGQGSKNVYTTGSFKPCPRPGFHGCLDRYLPTGNLQFRLLT